MTENIKKFAEIISKDEEMKKRASKSSKEELIDFAKELGICLTDEDFEVSEQGEVSEDELAAAVGGAGFCVLLGFGQGKDPIDCVLMGWEEDLLCTLVGVPV